MTTLSEARMPSLKDKYKAQAVEEVVETKVVKKSKKKK